MPTLWAFIFLKNSVDNAINVVYNIIANNEREAVVWQNYMIKNIR